jgi:hypothetical protein
MEIVRNPREGFGFLDPNLKCSICQKQNTYFISVQPYLFCKGCLTNMIGKINFATTNDIQELSH